jgi:tight adherence protein B
MSPPPGVMPAVAAAGTGLACWLLCPPPVLVRRRVTRSSLSRAVLSSRSRAFIALSAVSSGLLVALDGTQLALGLVLLAGAAAAAALAGRARAARRAGARRAAVVEVCEALAGELRAGQPFVAALEHCLDLWPELEPVVAAARLGADVPASLRRLARASGAEGLADVAAAWQVSERSGAGLASALAQVARTSRARESTRQLVQGELASAQATARLVAGLPLASLAMSAGIGGHPWYFLLDTSVGVACLAGGLAFAFVGLLWIDRIAAGALRT